MCVCVALVIQHAMHMRRIMSHVTYLALPHLPTLSHKRHDYRKKATEEKIYVLICSTTFA